MPLTDAMRHPVNLIFRLHAIQRMFERKVDADDIRHVLATGEVIEDYPTDTPYPSCLVLGWRGTRPLHIVVAYNTLDDKAIATDLLRTAEQMAQAEAQVDVRRYAPVMAAV